MYAPGRRLLSYVTEVCLRYDKSVFYRVYDLSGSVTSNIVGRNASMPYDCLSETFMFLTYYRSELLQIKFAVQFFDAAIRKFR